MEQRHVLSPGAADRPQLTREALARLLAGGAGRRTDPEFPAPALERDPTPAAVLVPLVEREGGLTVLLTQRTDHLANHPGQISFPGGRLEDLDCGDAVTCALRETEEEIGLARDCISVVGRLDEYITGTGFSVIPVVAMVAPPFELLPDPFEVAEVFEAPLSFLVHEQNRRLRAREVAGRSRPFWEIVWRERVIWGATAGILVNLADVLGRAR